MIKRIPGATYRLQFNRDFTFKQAYEIASYLHELGITDCYASPLFKARPQSTHGYDVCDFGRLNPNLGSTADFEALASRLRDLGIGLILDLVPNHMSTDTSNAWWFDVLENGSASKYASWFDIDWQRFDDGKVVLPILEDDFQKDLVAGKLRVVSEGQKFFIACYDRQFPLSPESQTMLSRQSAQDGLDSTLKKLNSSPGQPNAFQTLNELLEQQHYRLASWRTIQTNYRRFFDVNDLISLRMELPEVFEATHSLISSLVEQGKVTGLRIDHPDGLWNPKQYLQRLHDKFGSFYIIVEKILTDDEALPQNWAADGTTGYDFLNRLNGLFVAQDNKEAFDRIYHQFIGRNLDFSELVYEAKKRILQNSFLSELNALNSWLDEIANSIQPDHQDHSGALREALIQVLACFPVYRTYVTEETNELSDSERTHVEYAIQNARARLSTQAQAAEHKGLRLIQELLLIRSPDRLDNSSKTQCRKFVMKFQQLTGPLMAKALEDTTFYNFNRLISLNEVGGNPDSFGSSIDDFHQHNLQKVVRWPHSLLATATHDTKRGEDLRARINVLSELPDEWQSALARWQKLNANKKSIVNNCPAPDANDEYFVYQTLVGAWPGQMSTAEQSASFLNRLRDYMLKSIKESKTHTSWTRPNAEYETATMKFVEQVLQDSPANSFLGDFTPFQKKIAFFGRLNSLSQVLLKLTAPGVPDFYQGTELWDLNLVDPDNRRPVNYELRRRLLADLKAQFTQDGASHLLADLLNDDQLGRSKLYLIWRVLEFRNRRRELFDTATYVPLTAVGEKQNHVCAFARRRANALAIVIAPRLFTRLTNSKYRLPLGAEVWTDTRVVVPCDYANGDFLNVLTNEKVRIAKRGGADDVLSLAETLALFPVALLERAS